jgi:hypothetical protein
VVHPAVTSACGENVVTERDDVFQFFVGVGGVSSTSQQVDEFIIFEEKGIFEGCGGDQNHQHIGFGCPAFSPDGTVMLNEITKWSCPLWVSVRTQCPHGFEYGTDGLSCISSGFGWLAIGEEGKEDLHTFAVL